MDAITVARKVVGEGTCYVIRARKDAPGQYDAIPYLEAGKKRGWTALDLFTAGMLVGIHDALNEANRAKFRALSIQRMVEVGWKLYAKAKA